MLNISHTGHRTIRSKNSNLSYTLNNQQQIELLKISVKKQTDRKQKLQKLLEKYRKISNQQKQHIKKIKSYIIELKDTPNINKPKFYIDPNIYVNGYLSTDTRKFLCTLLNTYSNIYENNTIFEKDILQICEIINRISNQVTFNQELLFKLQKQNISEHVQLQGQHLKQKSKFKEENNKAKQIQDQYLRINEIYKETQGQYQAQLLTITKLKQQIKKINDDREIIEKQILLTQQIKEQNNAKLTDELAYRCKYQQQIQQINAQISSQQKRNTVLKKKIQNQKIRILKTKDIKINELLKHRIKISILNQKNKKNSDQYVI